MKLPPVIVKVTGHVAAAARGADLRYIDENIPSGQRPSVVLNRVDIEALIKFLGRKRRRRFPQKPGR
ncbi:MAG: hypothetical protein LV481_05265 [Methylacidiphilales bacterium]|nr:hypothetical protein [Candidatus Methylacidiphilales bacterium]